MATVTSALCSLVSACSLDTSPSDEPQLSEAVSALNAGLGDPCLEEAADDTLKPQGSYLGVASPTTWNWLSYSACSWYMTEYKTSGLQTPRLYVQATLVAGNDEVQCRGLSIHERVYTKRKPASDWTYVGEASRGGVWEDGACEMRLDFVSEQNVVPEGVGPLTVRVLATARHGTGIARPLVIIDDVAIPED